MSGFWDQAATGWQLLRSANEEALRAGHQQVDTDHLLLGLIAGGEPVLLSSGIDLTAARAAMVQTQRADLAAVHIEAPDLPQVGSGAVAGGPLLPLTHRAREALGVGSPRSGQEVLSALLVDPHDPAARLLRTLEVNGVKLPPSERDDAAVTVRPVPADDPAARVSSDAGESGAWRSTTVTELVRVPPAQLWALLSDPCRLSDWDQQVGEVEVIDGSKFLSRPPLTPGGGRHEQLTVTHQVSALRANQLLEWVSDYPTGLRTWLRVDLEPHGPGTRVTMTHRTASGRGRGRLAAALLARSMRRRLPELVRALAHAA